MKRAFFLFVTLMSLLAFTQASAQTDSLRLKVKKHKLKENVKAVPHASTTHTVSRTTQPVRTEPSSSTTVNVNTNTPQTPRTNMQTSGSASASHTSVTATHRTTIRHSSHVTRTTHRPARRHRMHHYTKTTTTTVSQ